MRHTTVEKRIATTTRRSERATTCSLALEDDCEGGAVTVTVADGVGPGVIIDCVGGTNTEVVGVVDVDVVSDAELVVVAATPDVDTVMAVGKNDTIWLVDIATPPATCMAVQSATPSAVSIEHPALTETVTPGAENAAASLICVDPCTSVTGKMLSESCAHER